MAPASAWLRPSWKTSPRKVLIRPPTRLRLASSTRTRCPAASSSRAQTMPATPAPTTTTSRAEPPRTFS